MERKRGRGKEQKFENKTLPMFRPALLCAQKKKEEGETSRLARAE